MTDEMFKLIQACPPLWGVDPFLNLEGRYPQLSVGVGPLLAQCPPMRINPILQGSVHSDLVEHCVLWRVAEGVSDLILGGFGSTDLVAALQLRYTKELAEAPAWQQVLQDVRDVYFVSLVMEA